MEYQVMNLFKKLSRGLKKSQESLLGKLARLAGRRGRLSENDLEEIEEILIEGDLGVDTAMEVVERLRARLRSEKPGDEDAVDRLLREILLEMVRPAERTEKAVRPLVILVVGVNGTGKTTTIGKLMKYYRDQGRSVLVGAADTFRAAAAEQLEIWCQRNNVPLVQGQPGADPAAVAYDTLQSGLAREVEVVIIDTAGRLHNKKNLMQELEKMHRALGKLLPDAPHEVLLVLDATTGQNALSQARLFTESTPVTGLVLTKLDGTARGGIAIAIHRELQIPVRFVGLGEGIDDLEVFNPRSFVEALFAG